MLLLRPYVLAQHEKLYTLQIINKNSKQKWSKKMNTILFLFSFMGNLQVWSLTFTLYVNLVLTFQMYQFSP